MTESSTPTPETDPTQAWAEAARTVLLEVAGEYNAVVTTKELATQVQVRTGVSSTRAAHHWVGNVLGLVADRCAELDEPILSSLCVNAQGSVTPAYARMVATSGVETAGDADDHAAQERLACYQRHDATGLPAHGGRATLTPRLAATRARERKVRMAERVLPVCPSCHHVLASTGVCDNCD